MEVSEFVRSLLTKRGVTEPADIATFLTPDYDLHTHSPFLLQDMESAVARLLTAIAQNERIAIYADYDCDGIPGAALLSDFLKKVGYENFEVYLPHRDREGYGFHTEAIAALAGRKVTLIITVDVGTNAIAAIGYAKQLGIDVIVSDHHEMAGALPVCVALLNPKRAGYPFPHLCGAAVAWKLVQATLHEGKKRSLEAFLKVPDGWEKWLLDLVAIATVADLVPLIGENRVLAQYGLRVLRRSRRPGIHALVNRLRLRRADLTEDDIAFSIAPRINAASRMDEPQSALSLLTTEDGIEAEHYASHLEGLNTQRKGVVASLVRQARKTLRERFTEEEKVIVFGNPEWKPALLGLAANSLLESRRLPDGSQGIVCLWGRDAVGNLKGSCRSDGSVSVVELFSKAQDVFVEFGGHERSGGFTVSHERVHTLHDVLSIVEKKIENKGPVVDKVSEDGALSLSDMSTSLFAEVSRLAPFGMGNPKPMFRVEDVLIASVRRFGRDQGHIELALECRHSGARMRAFDFFRSAEDFTTTPELGREVSILGSIERDAYRGGLALRLADVLSARVVA